MTKEQYIQELRNRLRSLPKEEIEDAISYVSEYFDEAGVGNEEQVIHDLGNPMKFASQIKANYEIKTAELMRYHATGKEIESTKSPWKSVFLILLGILSLPISFPLAIVVICMVIALAVLIFVPFIILIAVIFGFILSIGVLIFMLINGAVHSVADACLMIGGLCILGALICLAVAGCIALGTRFFPWLSVTLGRWYHRLKGDETHE